MKGLRHLIAILFLLIVWGYSLHGQPIFSDIAVSHTTCVSPCLNGTENANYASDGNTSTYAYLKNNLGVGSSVEIVMGFSTAGDPGSMIVIPIKKAGSLLDAGLLSLVSIDVLDASGQIILQKSGLNTLDIGVLSVAENSSAITLFAPSTGSYQISKIRVKLFGAASVLTSLYIGDPFYVKPTGSNCGIKYASSATPYSSGICVLCAINNPEKAADTDFSDYAEIKVVVGVAATRAIELGFTGGGKSGDYVGIIMGTGSGLLDISLLGNVTITLYNGASVVQTVTASSLLGASLLNGGSQRSLVGFNASSDFTAIRISMTAVLGLINTMRIYGALTFDPTPSLVSLILNPTTSTICAGTASQITASSGYTSYKWSSGQSTGQITVSDSGSYMATAYDANGCPFYSPPAKISLLPKPAVPTVTFEPTDCLGGNVKFNLNTTNTAYTYQLLHSVNGLEGGLIAGTGTALSMFSVPVYSSASYRIDVTNTATGCHNKSATDLIVTKPQDPTRLAGNLDHVRCLVKPGNRFVHFIQPGTNRILMSINPYTNDLGQVDVSGYVDNAPIVAQACGTYQSWFATALLNRRWHVEPQNQPTTSVSTRLYFDYDEYSSLSNAANANANPNDDVYTLSSLVLSKYDGANEDGNVANNCGNGNTVMYTSSATGTASAQLTSFIAGGRYTDFTVPHFSEFWLNGNSNGNISPLPIELASFDAVCDDSVRLYWTTVSELNNDYFTLEKSTNGTAWEMVTRVKGASFSNTPIQYTYSDVKQVSTLYYRLSQTDINGTVKTFNPISVSCEVNTPENQIRVFPNPTNEYIYISFPPGEAIAQNISMYDIAGKLIYTKTLPLTLSESTVQVQLPSLPTGLYSLQVGGKHLEKVLIDK